MTGERYILTKAVQKNVLHSKKLFPKNVQQVFFPHPMVSALKWTPFVLDLCVSMYF